MPETAPSAPQRIGIAVVLHGGCVLVGTRGPKGPLAGYAEFPGGKCHPGESPADCAVRECREETGLAVIAGETLCVTRWSYPHGDVELHFVQCQFAADCPATMPSSPFRWLNPGELRDQPFPPANAAVIRILST